ncbi:hypothetical protein ACVWZZ_002316 [Bradyrhizobium sp. LM6.10]|jgi:hypothetical protein
MPQAPDLSLEGAVAAAAADRRHHFSKPTHERIVLVEGYGVEGDAHAGAFVRHRYLARRRPRLANLRQVHLIPSELFASLLEAGFKVAAGDLGENFTTTGLDLERMPLGTLIELGPSTVIELTGLRTPCILIDRFRAGLKRQMLSSAEKGPPFKSGVLGVVRVGGTVAAGDTRGFGSRRPPSGPCRLCRSRAQRLMNVSSMTGRRSTPCGEGSSRPTAEEL